MRIKKTIYIMLVMLLWLLLAEIAHWLIEIHFVNVLLSDGLVPRRYVFLGTHCFLPPYLQFSLLIVGLIVGYFTGQAWWRIVYVERRHWRMKK